MLKIIKYGCEFNIPNNCIATIDAAYDGIRIMLNDRSEISINMIVTQQLKSLLPIVKSCSTGNITLNLDNALSGKYDSVVCMTMTQTNIEPQPVLIKHEIVDSKKTVKKSVGRPSKKKTKNT
jgi:hypothetical protein